MEDPRGSFFCECVLEGALKTQVGKEGGEGGWGGVAGTAEGGSRLRLPVLRSPPAPVDPLRLTGGFCPSRLSGGMALVGEGLVEVVLLALCLERARQFIKAFGERGGNLHVT